MKKLLLGAAIGIILSACTQPGTQAPAETPSALPPLITSAPQRESYQPSGIAALTLPDLAAALQSGEVTAEAVVTAYMERIDRIDWSGPQLQAVLTLNPDAMDIAKALDAKRVAGEPLGPLHGIPVLLKDNIESLDDMATTAGALALKDNVTGRDAPLTAGLREAGAIILGKSNLSQWANFRSNQSMSGWSALGGQVRNPHMLDRNPCGSSSGSGAAVAASLSAGAVGTETNGSIICPSNVNGIVGFKPTVGLVSQVGIIPISETQDTAGPMTRTVTGAAMMLSAMATGPQKTDYAAGLDAQSLDGLRIGVTDFARGSNPDIHARFGAALADMEKAGAVLVRIKNFSPDVENFGGKSFDILKYEFKAGLNAYLATTPESVKARTLSDIITFNNEHAGTELALFGQDILEASDAMGPLTDAAYIDAKEGIRKAMQDDGIDALMRDNNVAVLVSPSGPVAGRIDPVNGDVWPSWAGAGGYAARAGYPHLTVPMGHVHGVPVGVSFIGGKDTDAQILSYGFAYEQLTHHLRAPQYLNTAEDQADIKSAMTRP